MIAPLIRPWCSTLRLAQDLCTSSYFNNAIPVIELQNTKQANRLAACLNTIFD